MKNMPELPEIEEVFIGEAREMNTSLPLFIETTDDNKFVGYRNGTGKWQPYHNNGNTVYLDQDIKQWDYCTVYFPVGVRQPTS